MFDFVTRKAAAPTSLATKNNLWTSLSRVCRRRRYIRIIISFRRVFSFNEHRFLHDKFPTPTYRICDNSRFVFYFFRFVFKHGVWKTKINRYRGPVVFSYIIITYGPAMYFAACVHARRSTQRHEIALSFIYLLFVTPHEFTCISVHIYVYTPIRSFEVNKKKKKRI